MGRGSLGRVLLLQVSSNLVPLLLQESSHLVPLLLQESSHLVPLLLQESSHLVPLLLQESSLHFFSFFVKTFLVYFNLYTVTVLVMRERLISSLQSEEHRMQTELKEKKRRIGDLEMALRHFLPSQVQVNGEGRERATAGQMTSIGLSVPSIAISSLPSPLVDQLSCQLTDPNSQHVECSIASTQPGMATVSYTPTLRGAHQMKITVGDTDIPGSPFTVRVLPSLEMRGVPINIIDGDSGPWGVALSESGEVVVSEHGNHWISVLSREGKKIRKFGSEGSGKGQFNGPYGVAITTDNYILVADNYNHRIQMFTMKGEFVRSVGEKGHGPLQFDQPAGIAVHC